MLQQLVLLLLLAKFLAFAPLWPGQIQKVAGCLEKEL